MPFNIGEDVGPYQILEQLGHGGMAIVYRAYHPALDRYVAIKVIYANLSTEPEFLARFKREAKVIAKLDNPHIVPVFDYDEHEGQPYLVLKYIDGYTLKERMKVLPLSKSDILKIVVSVGEGLQYAHNLGILHRDIKPSNVLMAKDGRIYLADFGLAKIAEISSSITGETMVGTPEYMSPEQVMSSDKLDEGADIYSFGVMIYELVVGRVPFEADTPLSVVESHIFAPVPPPRSIRPDLSMDVEKVLLKALSKDRGDRYEKVTDLVVAFNRAWISDSGLPNSGATLQSASSIAALNAEDGKSFALVSERTVLGRNSTTKGILNDIDLSDLDTSKIISRHHAMIRRQKGVFMIYDLNSRNGTYLNVQRISPSEPLNLNFGDVVELGKGGVKLTFSNRLATNMLMAQRKSSPLE